MGGSAGGLLMGAVVNMAPDLYHGVVAAVPFVDVINTMMDPSIPLTSNEWDEWGDPRNKEEYDYIIKYSPYNSFLPVEGNLVKATPVPEFSFKFPKTIV